MLSRAKTQTDQSFGTTGHIPITGRNIDVVKTVWTIQAYGNSDMQLRYSVRLVADKQLAIQTCERHTDQSAVTFASTLTLTLTLNPKL